MLEMKTLLTMLLLMFASFLVVGCSSSQSPEDVAKLAFEATVSADMATAKPFYCEAMQQLFPSQEEMDALQKELNVQFTFDFSGLTYEVTEQTDEATTVTVAGTLVVNSPAGSEKLNYNELIHLVLTDGTWLVCEQ